MKKGRILVRIEINDGPIQKHLGRLGLRFTPGVGLTKLLRATAGIMMDEVEDTLEKEGQPKWEPLSDVTIALRAEKGHWPGKMLQVSGRLAASISSSTGARSAVVGTNVKYANIHQVGGKAGRGRKVSIPARPYLIITPKGTTRILAAANRWSALEKL